MTIGMRIRRESRRMSRIFLRMPHSGPAKRFVLCSSVVLALAIGLL
jgi:hypothetical protein